MCEIWWRAVAWGAPGAAPERWPVASTARAHLSAGAALACVLAPRLWHGYRTRSLAQEVNVIYLCFSFVYQVDYCLLRLKANVVYHRTLCANECHHGIGVFLPGLAVIEIGISWGLDLVRTPVIATLKNLYWMKDICLLLTFINKHLPK